MNSSRFSRVFFIFYRECFRCFPSGEKVCIIRLTFARSQNIKLSMVELDRPGRSTALQKRSEAEDLSCFTAVPQYWRKYFKIISEIHLVHDLYTYERTRGRQNRSNFSTKKFHDLCKPCSRANLDTWRARGPYPSSPLCRSLYALIRESIQSTIESRSSGKRYRLRAFTVRTRKIDREEVIREHKAHLPSFYTSVFTTTSSSSASVYPMVYGSHGVRF